MFEKIQEESGEGEITPGQSINCPPGRLSGRLEDGNRRAMEREALRDCAVETYNTSTPTGEIVGVYMQILRDKEGKILAARAAISPDDIEKDNWCDINPNDIVGQSLKPEAYKIITAKKGRLKSLLEKYGPKV